MPHYTDSLKSLKKDGVAQNYHRDFKYSAVRVIKKKILHIFQIQISSYHQREDLSHLDLFYSRFQNNAGTANSGCY